MNDLAVADILVGNDLFKSFKKLKNIIQIAAFAHVEENLQTEFHLEKSNLLEFVSKFFQSQNGGSSSAENLTQAKWRECFSYCWKGSSDECCCC